VRVANPWKDDKLGSFAQAEFAGKKKITRREKFLARMEEVIAWGRLLAVIAPH
jgi:transposase, IS5 family